MLKNHFKTNLFISIFCRGDPHLVRSWSDGRLELQTSLENLSETSQITRIIQNSFHGMSFFIFFLFSPLWELGGWGPELNGFFFNPSLRQTFIFFWIHCYFFSFLAKKKPKICILIFSFLLKNLNFPFPPRTIIFLIFPFWDSIVS